MLNSCPEKIISVNIKNYIDIACYIKFLNTYMARKAVNE